MIPFVTPLWTAFLAWYHDPSRILGQFDRVSRRLSASSSHFSQLANNKRAAAEALLAAASAHARAADRAASVNAKLAALIA